MLRRTLPLIFLTLIMACAPRGLITIYPDAAGVGVVEPIFLATSRGAVATPDLFGNERSKQVSFARYDVSIPPVREPGSVDFPGRSAPDPQQHMLTVKETRFSDDRVFIKALNAQMHRPKGNRRVVVFVHGFNTNLAEGVYRIAQMAHDMEMSATVVHFAWPSAGNALGYVHDRDSALFSRDALEHLLDNIARSDATEIVLIGHSMGALLTMETLRQMSIRGQSAAYGKLQSVVLISPDIDVDVFRSQMASIKNPPQPFVVFGSPRDKALRVSSWLTGEPDRLGNMTDTSQIADLPITYVDIQAFSDGSSHFAVATSPELLALLDQFRVANNWLKMDGRRNTNPLTGILLAAGTATKIVLSPVVAVSDAISNPNGTTTKTYTVAQN